MDQANVYVCLPTRYEGRRYGLPINFLYEPHSIVVNRHAKRFVSEAHLNIGEALDARVPDGSPLHLPCYLVGDHRFLKSSFDGLTASPTIVGNDIAATLRRSRHAAA